MNAGTWVSNRVTLTGGGATLLLGFAPTLLLLAFFLWLARRQMGTGGGLIGAFGRSTARRVVEGALWGARGENNDVGP